MAYTVTLSEAHERALDSMREQNGGGLTREEFVQFMTVRALENHALTMREELSAKVASLSDEELNALIARREEALAVKAEEPANA